MLLKELYISALQRLNDKELGIQTPTARKQLETYKSLKKKFPGRADRDWLRHMLRGIRADAKLEKLLKSKPYF